MYISDDAPAPLLAPAVDSLPIQVAVIDEEGRIVAVNDSWVEFGRENGLQAPETYVDANYLAVTDAADSESAARAANAIRDVISGVDTSASLEYPCHSPGERRWFELVATSFEIGSDRFVALAHRNISTQRLREQELELYEKLLENQPGVAILFDEAGRVLVANQRLLQITGLSAADVLGRSARSLPEAITGNLESFDEVHGLLVEVLEGGLNYASTEVGFETVDGERIIANVQIEPATVDETTEGAILTARDITEWQEREARLRLYQRAVESSTEMLAAVNTDYEFLFANESYREFHGIEAEDLERRTLSDVLEPHIIDQVLQRVDRVLEGETIMYTQNRQGPDGSDHPINIHYYPLRDRDGTIMGAVAAMRDMTDQQERERQLHVLDRVLRHNMHNDMNVITGYAELIEDRGEGEVPAYATRIRETAHDLLGSVDKQRNITELLSKPHRFLRIDLVDMMDQIVREARETAPTADISLSAPNELQVRTIPKLENAFREVIENAITHVDIPQPEVHVDLRSRQDAVEIVVEDNGPGIPEAERGVLTGDREIGPLYHGSGMGLWVVNWIVSQSNGTLAFEPNDPRGSTVIIRLPREPLSE